MQNIFWSCLTRQMCNYEMDPASIGEDTERTRFCPQTDGWTDRWTDRWKDGWCETSIPPFQLHWSRGYNGHKTVHHSSRYIIIKTSEAENLFFFWLRTTMLYCIIHDPDDIPAATHHNHWVTTGEHDILGYKLYLSNALIKCRVFNKLQYWWCKYKPVYLGWSLVQVMACYWMAASHYLNQYWLIVSGILGTNLMKLELKFKLLHLRLEQLEHLRSEIPPLPHDYPY